jgi:hypothetical protein
MFSIINPIIVNFEINFSITISLLQLDSGIFVVVSRLFI